MRALGREPPSINVIGPTAIIGLDRLFQSQNADTKNLVNFAGNQIAAGVVLYGGDQTIPLGDNLWRLAPLCTHRSA